jgi:uncharacterized protein
LNLRSSGEPPEHPTSETTPFGWVEVTVWTLGALLLMVFSIGLIQSAHPDAALDMVTLSGTSSAVFLTLTAFLLGRHSNENSLQNALGLRSVPLWALVGCLVLGGLSQFPALFVADFTEHFFPIPEAEALERTAMLRPQGLPQAGLLAFFLTLLVPFAEEAFFRGALFGALRRSGRSALSAASATGSAFLLSHLDPHYWPALALVAASLSLLRAASGSLVPSLAFHIGFNAYTVATATFGVGGSKGDMPLPWQAQLALSSAAVLVGALLVAFFMRSGVSLRYRTLERGQDAQVA